MLHWNSQGLRVLATEYHSTELLLGWEHIGGLAEAAQENPDR